MILPARTQLVHLRASGTSVVVDVSAGREPAFVYWGTDLGELGTETLAAISLAGVDPPVGSSPDRGLRLGVLALSSSGWAGRPGLAGHRDDGSAWAPALGVDSVELTADDPVDEGATVCAGPGSLICSMVDPQAGIRARVVVELLAGGLLRVRAEVTNEDPRPWTLDELAVVLPVPLSAGELLDFSGRWAHERAPQRRALGLGCWLREGRHGRTGFDAPTMSFCGEAGFGFASGQLWGLHVAFSGNHRCWVERRPEGRQVMAGGELLLPGEVRLDQGEGYRGPWVYAVHADGLDDAAHLVHDWLRTLPGHPDPQRPVTLNVWEAVYFDHDEQTLLSLAERAARIGVERFVLDDGWFLGRRDDTAGLGDWVVDPRVWPAGLHPLADRVHELGMQFGLWFEPEMVSPDSELARAHPEWIMATGDRLPAEWRHQQVLDLAIPQAFEHVHAAMGAILDEYEIAYLKWDHNRDLVEAGNRQRAGSAAVHDQTLACYRLMDLLRAEHPGLEIESCASGGGRIDLEMARHAQRFWLSDCIDPHERAQIMRWSAQLLPAEMMGTHVASPRNAITGRVGELSFRAGLAIWGHLGVEWNLLEAGDDELSRLGEWISFHKQEQALLYGGDLVRRELPGGMTLHGVVARNRDEALYGLVRLESSPLARPGQLLVPGLDDRGSYRLCPRLVGGGPDGVVLPAWCGPDNEGIVMTGRALRLHGVRTPQLWPDEILILQAVRVG
ncbi:MAG: alpha-galactosidase [Propionibacterium sp.]